MNPTKPGWKTSEFWLSTSAQLIGMALASGLIPTDGSLMKILGLAAALLSTLGYTVARTSHKNAVANAVADIALGAASTTANPQ